MDWWLSAVTALKSAGLGMGAAVAAGGQALFGLAAIPVFLISTVIASLLAGAVLWVTPPAPSTVSGRRSEADELVSSATSRVGRARLFKSVDTGFWLVVVGNVFLTYAWLIPSIVLPYVLTGRLGESPALTSVAFVLNTMLLVFLQTTVTQRTKNLRRTRSVLIGGAFFLTCIGVFAVLGEVPTSATVLMLVIGVIAFSMAEMLVAPPITATSMAAGAVRDRGRNSAIFQTSWAVSTVSGPVILGVLLDRGDSSVWVALGGAVLIGLMFVLLAERRLGVHALVRSGQ